MLGWRGGSSTQISSAVLQTRGLKHKWENFSAALSGKQPKPFPWETSGAGFSRKKLFQ